MAPVAREAERPVIEITSERAAQLHIGRRTGRVAPLKLGDDGAPTGIVVRVSHDDLHALRRQGLERCKRRQQLLPGLIELGGHRMLRKNDQRARDVDAEPFAHLFGRGEIALLDEIDRREPDGMHAPRFLTHRHQAIAGLLVGGEVQMGEFRHRMPHRIIERATFGEIATLDVRGRDIHLRAGDDGGEALESICVDDQHVGFDFGQRTAHGHDARANRLRRGVQGVGQQIDLDLGMHGEPVGFDLRKRAAELIVEVGPRDDQSIFEVGVCVDRLEDRELQTVLGAIAGKHGDDAFRHGAILEFWRWQRRAACAAARRRRVWCR
jgi:hypothetical protein